MNSHLYCFFRAMANDVLDGALSMCCVSVWHSSLLPAWPLCVYIKIIFQVSTVSRFSELMLRNLLWTLVFKEAISERLGRSLWKGDMGNEVRCKKPLCTFIWSPSLLFLIVLCLGSNLIILFPLTPSLLWLENLVQLWIREIRTRG